MITVICVNIYKFHYSQKNPMSVLEQAAKKKHSAKKGHQANFSKLF